MVKSMEIEERTLFEHPPMKSSYYQTTVWIRLNDLALLEVEVGGVSFSIPDSTLELYLEAFGEIKQVKR